MGGLRPGVVSVQQGVSFGGASVWGVSARESLSGEISIWGGLCSGVSVQGGLCLGVSVQGDSLSGRSCEAFSVDAHVMPLGELYRY